MVLDAVNDFILQFVPDVTQARLYRGYSNRMALPGENDYTVFAVAAAKRVGTNVNDYAQAVDGRITTRVLREYAVDVDFCSTSQEIANARAVTIENIGRSYIAVEFFKKYDLHFNYCDDIQYIPFTDETDQYVERYRVRLHFTKWEETSAPQEYAERVSADVINIDAKYKY